MPYLRSLYDRFLQATAPFFTRLTEGATPAASVLPPLFAPIIRDNGGQRTLTTGRRGQPAGPDTRTRCANYLNSGPPQRRVDRYGRVVPLGNRSASNSPRGANFGLPRSPTRIPSRPPQTSPSRPQSGSPSRPGSSRPGSPEFQRPQVRVPTGAIRVPTRILRGREILHQHLRAWWQSREAYCDVQDAIAELEREGASEEQRPADYDERMEELQRQEQAVGATTERLGAEVAPGQARQQYREAMFTAATGVAFSDTVSTTEEAIEDFTQELFRNAEPWGEDDEASHTSQLSSRAASNRRFAHKMRNDLPAIDAAYDELWELRETYMDRRLRHEAGNDPGIPNWDPTWPREIFDREHLREGMRLTKNVKDLHDSWRARLEEAKTRGLGPFDEYQGEMFPHMAEGYTVSWENERKADAPRNGIMEWMSDPTESEHVDANRCVAEAHKDDMMGLEFAQPPEPGESASCCEVALHIVEGIMERREGSGYPLWRRNVETRDLGYY
nr:hypothetical protein B0A51_10456 [Rachicladosporium sp. CCFEE 5018]